MSEIDRVFARFRDDKIPTAERHEQRNITKRGAHGTQTSRTVEVVHVRSGAVSRPADQWRPSAGVRAAAWDDGFPVRNAAQLPAAPQPDVSAPVKPTTHVMPAWEPAPAETVTPVPGKDQAPVPRASSPARRRIVSETARRVADPFDPADDGANCIRCGYAIEPPRERLGRVTCAGCG